MIHRRGCVFRTTVTVHDARPTGEAAFARYFEWQRQAREQFVGQLLPETGQTVLGRLVTAAAEIRYHQPLWVNQPVAVTVNVVGLTRAMLFLRFGYFHGQTDVLVAEGSQRLLVADETGHVGALPADVRQAAEAWLRSDAARRA
jgi:acyl-CoA thioesterase FadM